ncbi:MAG: 16S rRNA (cytosine(967)-C(5))-methyltransferase RsmB [Candidatus Marinimicrobia bacterium]|nr:16S rRNA (cytosine(967)-C(5))-methyltransferase RsmB [Candidatus Neomarinimicrobiota bacterium]MBL7030911.1 16S rRNA (cytosine(967)-C(5))-methyltransferase RsmB [Candidatus Neomarinimicrobiota bacterium]
MPKRDACHHWGPHRLKMKDARYHAFHILKKYYRSNDRLKSVRDQYFKNNKLQQQDISRSLVLTNEVVRWQGRLDYWIELFLDKPLHKLHPSIHLILRLGFYEAVMDELIPQHAAVHSWVEFTKKELGKKFGGLVNALLRKTSAIDPNQKDENQSQSKWVSFPDWIIEKWTDQFGGEQTNQLCEYFNKPSYVDIRLNCVNESKDSIISQLGHLEVKFSQSPESDCFIRVASGLRNAVKSELFTKGLIHVQDRASGAVVELLDPQPGHIVLDVCAAPGTKSGYIVEKIKNDGKILASDISQARLVIGEKRADELKWPIQWKRKDASKDDFPMADRILIDAPCTGTGVMARRTDIRWRRNKDDMESMATIQKAIISHMAKYLKPGGVMVYATCSLEVEENWNVVKWFLKLNDNFCIESGKDFVPNGWLNVQKCLETFPPRDKVDGLFAARIKKNDE